MTDSDASNEREGLLASPPVRFECAAFRLFAVGEGAVVAEEFVELEGTDEETCGSSCYHTFDDDGVEVAEVCQ